MQRHLKALAWAAALTMLALIGPAGASAATQTFETPGSSSFVVPAGITSVSVEVFGAAGGSSGTGAAGGLGAKAAADLAVVPGGTLSVVVGGRGGNGVDGSPSTTCVAGTGGFNGGAGGGGCESETPAAGGGGGASEILDGATALIVAGGGGGGGANGTGGPGGNAGQDGTAGATGTAPNGGGGGGGGSQSAGGTGGNGQGGGVSGESGSAGRGGVGGFWVDGSGGGGGGGAFGGGGGGGSEYFAGGGGGGGSSKGPVGTVFTSGARAGAGKIVISFVYESSLTIAASPGVTLGGQVHATATLADGHEPGGTLEFHLFGPADATCSGAPAFTHSVSVAAPTSSYESTSFSPVAAGTYHWVATYSGDADNAGAESLCADPAGAVTIKAAEPRKPTEPAQPTDPVKPADPVTTPSSRADTPPASTAPLPAVRILHSPNKPHQPNPAGGPRYTFTFTDSAPAVTFYCRIDKRSFKACSSPAVYRGLAKGRHVFKVKSVDAAGHKSAVRSVTFTATVRNP